MWLGNPKEPQPILFRGIYSPEMPLGRPNLASPKLDISVWPNSCLTEDRASGHLPLDKASNQRDYEADIEPLCLDLSDGVSRRE